MCFLECLPAVGAAYRQAGSVHDIIVSAGARTDRLLVAQGICPG